MPTNPTQPPDPSLDEPWERMLKLRKPIEEAMNRNDWKRACELFVENIKLAEQMLNFARSYGSQADANNCERRVELYRQTYAQLTAEANPPTPCNCVLPPEIKPEERKITQAGQNELPVAGHGIAEQITMYMQLMARVSELNAKEREEFHNLMEIVATDDPMPTLKLLALAKLAKALAARLQNRRSSAYDHAILLQMVRQDVKATHIPYRSR
jgi:hypothetical protein